MLAARPIVMRYGVTRAATPSADVAATVTSVSTAVELLGAASRRRRTPSPPDLEAPVMLTAESLTNRALATPLVNASRRSWEKFAGSIPMTTRNDTTAVSPVASPVASAVGVVVGGVVSGVVAFCAVSEALAFCAVPVAIQAASTSVE